MVWPYCTSRLRSVATRYQMRKSSVGVTSASQMCRLLPSPGSKIGCISLLLLLFVILVAVNALDVTVSFTSSFPLNDVYVKSVRNQCPLLSSSSSFVIDWVPLLTTRYASSSFHTNENVVECLFSFLLTCCFGFLSKSQSKICDCTMQLFFI